MEIACRAKNILKVLQNDTSFCFESATIGSWQVQIFQISWCINGTTAFSIMTFSIMSFSIMTFSIMSFSIMTFSIMTFSITTLSIMTFSIIVNKS